LDVSEASGAHLFECTKVWKVEDKGGKLGVATSEGEMQANNIIFTTGYETLPVGKKGADINRSYVIVSKPLSSEQIWYKNTLIWETKRPYLYMRTTADRRVIMK